MTTAAPLSTFDAILFDFDGTLADTFPCFVRVFDEATKRAVYAQQTNQAKAAARAAGRAVDVSAEDFEDEDN